MSFDRLLFFSLLIIYLGIWAGAGLAGLRMVSRQQRGGRWLVAAAALGLLGACALNLPGFLGLSPLNSAFSPVVLVGIILEQCLAWPVLLIAVFAGRRPTPARDRQ